MTIKIKSGFAILDVKSGRKSLSKEMLKGNKIPVTIKGFINSEWSYDDGESIEFEVIVNSAELGKPIKNKYVGDK